MNHATSPSPSPLVGFCMQRLMARVSTSPITAGTAVTILIALATMLAQTMPGTSNSDGTQEIRAAVTLISESALAALAINNNPALPFPGPAATAMNAASSPAPVPLLAPGQTPHAPACQLRTGRLSSPTTMRSVPSRSTLGECTHAVVDAVMHAAA